MGFGICHKPIFSDFAPDSNCDNLGEELYFIKCKAKPAFSNSSFKIVLSGRMT